MNCPSCLSYRILTSSKEWICGDCNYGRTWVNDILNRKNISRWQPIETVPKIGIVLLSDGENQGIGKFADGTLVQAVYLFSCNPFVPTHWQPMPQPPEKV